MQDSASNARSGVGRWCSRALFVLGGAVAGTAAAWALSTQAASASTVENPVPAGEAVVPVVSGMDETLDSVSQTVSRAVSGTASRVAAHAVSRAVSGTLDVAAGTIAEVGSGHGTPESVSHSPAESAPSDPEGVRAQNTAGSERDFLAAEDVVRRAVLRPAEHVVRSVAHLLSSPGDAPRVLADALDSGERLREFGDRVWDFFTPGSVRDRSPLPGSSAPGPVRAGAGAQPAARSGSGDEIHRGTVPSERIAPRSALSPVPHSAGQSDSDALRAGPRVDYGAPSAPGTVPAAPLITPYVAGSGVGSVHLDSPQFGFSTAALSAFDAAAAGSVRPGGRALLLQPQPQPGVSPD